MLAVVKSAPKDGADGTEVRECPRPKPKPDEMHIRVGAFLDALGNAVHATQITDLAGKSVAITGFGPIGAMAAAIAEHSGARTVIVTDVSDRALETARRWAASRNFANLHEFNVRS